MCGALALFCLHCSSGVSGRSCSMSDLCVPTLIKHILASLADTPWDEPTRRSPEFMAYFQGQLYDPWTRIDEEPLCG